MTMKRPSGSNADEWDVFIEYWCGSIKAHSFLAVQIAEAIDTAAQNKPQSSPDDAAVLDAYVEACECDAPKCLDAKMKTRAAVLARMAHPLSAKCEAAVDRIVDRATDRRAVIEECARVADRVRDSERICSSQGFVAASRIAIDIRALADKETGNG